MAAQTQERRKKIVVNREMQSRLILNITLLPAFALACVAVFTAVYCVRIMDDAVATDSEVPNLMPLFYLVVVFELLAAVFLVINSLKISHRVAGAAYRICKSIERIRGGDFAFSVNLRKGDYLTEIRDEMNLLLNWLNDHPPPGSLTRSMAGELKAAQQASPATAANTAATDPATTIY